MNRLKQIRERKSMALALLSARTSIPLHVLEDYEANETEIAPAHMKALSKALWVKPDELVVPGGVAAGPATAPPATPGTAAAPTGPAMATGAAPAPASSYSAPRSYAPAASYGAPRPPRPNGAPAPADAGRGGRPGGGRPRREPVVMPATDGQITEIMRLAARLNLSTEEIEEEFGRSIDNITRFDAREWIKKLREDAIAKAPPAKVHFGQWPGLKEDREAAYLAEQRDENATLQVTLFNGEVFTGRIVDFTPYTITVERPDAEGGEQVVLRKLAIAYYQRNGAQQAPAENPGAAKEVAPFAEPSVPAFSAPAEGATAGDGGAE